MNDQKPAAERIRPILQAMERSIDSVRRSRVKDSASPAAKPAAPYAVPVSHPPPILAQVLTNTQTNAQTNAATDAVTEDGTPRLKARPKRLNSPFVDPLHGGYRSQAG